MRTCSREQQLAGLATTPSKANIAGAPRLSCVKKRFVNTGLEKNFRIYLIIVVYSRIQTYERPQPFLKGNLGACSSYPRCSFRFPVGLLHRMSGQQQTVKPADPLL